MKRLNQQGAAAMLSVVIFAIIITVVVTAYLRSAISGQAEALNFDFSTRAYYAAEAGIQDAVRELNTSPTTSKDSCSNFVPSGSTGAVGTNTDLSYTCQLIDTTPSAINFEVAQDKNAMVRILPADLLNFPDLNIGFNLTLRWSKKNEGTYAARSDGSSTFPSQAVWSDNSWHPALRTSLLSYDTTPANKVTSLAIDQRVFFLNPLPGPNDTPPTVNRAVAQSSDSLVQAASCYNSGSTDGFGDYLCQQTLTLKGYDLKDGNHALFVRIHSLYASTAVELFITPVDSDNPIPLTGSVAQIDVTGKAGSTFRRVRQTFNYKNGVMIDNLPDAAVIGGDGICKNYSITNIESEFNDLGNGQCLK